jgi:hypothetical protein
MTRHITLAHLDGRPWASTAFLTGDPCDTWGWVLDTVCPEWDVSEDDVGCAETDDGDVVTVSGEPTYRILWRPALLC